LALIAFSLSLMRLVLVDVGDPLPAPRSLRQTMNLVLLPEPGEDLLLVSGVFGLLAVGRRRIARPR
jgi:hypothetical protein